MQKTDEAYTRIVSGREYWYETSVTIDGTGRLVTEDGDAIILGTLPDSEEPVAIQVDTSTPDSGFQGDGNLFKCVITQPLFKDSTPSVGNAMAGYVDIEMIAPFNVATGAKVCPYIRACNRDEKSEWMQQGEFYIDTRKQTASGGGFEILTIHAYDVLLLAETDYPADNSHAYPLLDIEMVRFIASTLGPGVKVDTRTEDLMTAGYKFPLPVNYSKREVLGMIAAAYGGNFVISPTGTLRLVPFLDLPKETSCLVTESGNRIILGQDENGEDVYILLEEVASE